MKESQSLEFKKSLAEEEEILETISAFSNTNGGKILVGIDENKDGSIREVVGIKIKGKEIENLTNEIKQNTDPVVFPSIELVKMEGEEVLSIDVKKSNLTPVFSKAKGFKRVGRSNIRLSAQEIREMTKESVDYSFTDLVCEGAKLEDIDEEKVKWFLKEAQKQRSLDINDDSSIKYILSQLKLLRNGQLTNAAVLLFGKKPQNFFLQAITKAIRFQGLDVTGEMFDFKTFEGDIITQVQKAEEFIFNHIPKKAWIEEGKLQRQEKWLYPPKAIREVLANALAHRDYATTSAVQIRIFDDRLEIWNPGTLPKELSIKKLKKKHESIPKNPLIARAFFWIKFVEEVGTGTNKIIEWCREWGLPDPKFEDTKTSLIVIFKPSSEKVSELTNVNERLTKVNELSDKEKAIFDVVKKNKRVVVSEVQNLLSISRVMANRYLEKLINNGLLLRKGQGKNTYYVLKLVNNRT